MGLLQKQLAIDMGTYQTRIYSKNKGVVVQEASLIAQERDSEKVIAVGTEAEEMLGRESEGLVATYPLSHGVIANFSATEQMLAEFIKRASGRFHITQPEAMMTVPSGATSTEQRAVIDAGKRAGLHTVYLIHGGVAAALGASLPIIEPRGHMVIDIGMGMSESAVLSLGGVVTSRTTRVGGGTITESIARALKRSFGLNIGLRSAEEIKQLIGSVGTEIKESTLTVTGRAHVRANPETIELHTDDIRPYIESSLERIVLNARRVLEQTPPDLIADIVERGIVLTGGSAQIDGLDQYLSQKLNVQCRVAQDPMLCGVKGAYLALSHLADYKRSLLGV
jgi:rod shape-determining protein MreB